MSNITQNTELASMIKYLERISMDQAAQDFYLTRKSKQMDQAERDPCAKFDRGGAHI